MIKVLFISQWYPHRYDFMAGLFVQKHAEAVGLFCEVKVLYVHADENIKRFEIVNNIQNNITEKIVYFPVNKKSPFHKINKVFAYLNAYYKGYKEIINEGFTPDLTHANILTRTGVVAYLLNKWKGIPYIITEHWSRYLPTRKAFNGTIRKLITKLIVKKACAILPVSQNLQNAMLRYGLKNSNYFVVNNVVDNYFFSNLKIEKREKKRIIHISCFDEQAKNVKGILRATYELTKTRTDFELIIIGTGIDFENVFAYSKELGLDENFVKFLGEKTNEEVANWIHNSDLFVLFSNYENSPVVISESLVLGKPVITTNVGGISEHVNQTNGILLEPGNDKKLTEKIDFMLDHFQNYDVENIKAEAKLKFSYENVGIKLIEIYKSILK